MTTSMSNPWLSAWALLGRTLTFRLTRLHIEALDWRCLALGLAFVGLVGAGRYWDDPDAILLHRLGVGSLAYVLGLSFLLWLIVLPMTNRRITYFHALTFVAMTSPPGFVYAVPVEWWTSANTAAIINGWLLAFVAAYRVALLAMFYRCAAALNAAGVTLLTLLPLALIMVVLAVLRIGPVVGRGMAGIRDGEPTAAQRLDEIIFGIGAYALMTLPVLLLVYLGWAGASLVKRRRADQESG